MTFGRAKQIKAAAAPAPEPRPRETISTDDLKRMSDYQIIMFSLAEILEYLDYPDPDLLDALAERSIAGTADAGQAKGRGR